MNLALFDLDGTITRKDTFLEFIKFTRGLLPFYTGMILMSPVLILYKVGVIKNWRAKEIVFGYFFGGMSYNEFLNQGKLFSETRLPLMVKASALESIKAHLANGDKVVIVTASSSEWIAGWSKPLGIDLLLTTSWKVSNGRLTGKLEGPNCYGEEKRKRIESSLLLTAYKDIYAYGDTSGDRPMLSLATHPFYRKFS